MTVDKKWVKENYLKFNNIAFNGSLPTNIAFKTNGRIKSCAYASYVMHLDTGIVDDLELVMNSNLDNNEEAHICTLLHEMIHIEDYVFHTEHFLREKTFPTPRIKYEKVKGYDAHGEWFLGECARINNMHLTKYQLSPKQTSEESKTEKNLAELKTRVCLMRVAINDPSKYWRILKTSERGMKGQVDTVKNNVGYWSRCGYVKFEWYKQSEDKLGSLSMFPNKNDFKGYLYSVGDAKKEEFIKNNGLILLDEITVNPDYKPERISDEKYSKNLNWNLEWSLKRIKQDDNFKKTGVGVYNVTDEVSNIKMQVTVDKKRDNVEILFNGGSPLNFGYKKCLSDMKSAWFTTPYGDMILKHLKDNRLIQEHRMKKLKNIIREVVEDYVSSDNDTQVVGARGRRQMTKQISDNAIMGAIE